MLVQVCPKGDTSSQGKVIDYFRCYGNGTILCFFCTRYFFSSLKAPARCT